jgi:hypothetical protein
MLGGRRAGLSLLLGNHDVRHGPTECLDPSDDVPPEPPRARVRKGRDDDLVDLLVVDCVLRGDDGVGIPEVT